MSSRRQYDPFEKPSEWFDHVDDSDPEATSRPGWHLIVAAIATLIVAVFILIPVLQTTVLRQRSASLPDEEFERTALLFGAAIMYQRSAGQALIFTADGAEPQVISVVSRVANLPLPAPGSGLQVRPAACLEAHRRAERCYEARVFDQRRSELPIALYYGLSNIDGQPKVVFVQTTQQIAGAQIISPG